ncbi:hypothetical protein M2119_001275 [Aurantimicrobium minutum]|uniref:septation protein SepH n=1 Tax=Aurantimicrobium minutum TaxID=708131 RepID=UPI002474B5FF|nr:septation protein SepH [Aurantimicrobium minutum]MDH6533038.1 hypothetical protein [Aurantimicrobium minutum]
MRELKVVDVDGATLIVSGDEGEEFRVLVDETSLRRLRHKRDESDGPRVSPKDIQAHLRAGLSNDEIAALTGASIDLIERFETPVLAEREFIISSSLAVPTQTTIETETGSLSTAFGTVITHRLHALQASGERWATWKEDNGSWIVKLEFTANGIDHDARWSFEPRKRTLAPVNSDASTLSQRGELTTGLIPKLRAVATEQRADTAPAETLGDEVNATFELSAVPSGVSELIPEETRDHSPTADLLEALRKRRNDRDTTPAWLRDEVSSATGPQNVPNDDTVIRAETVDFDATLNFTEPFELDSLAEAPQATGEVSRNDSKQVGRNGRPSMPSWDDIVFGTRSDDDPA